MTSSTATPAANPLAAFSDALATLVDEVGAGTLAVAGRHSRGLASGLVWEPGVVVTVAHVFRRTPAAVSFIGADGRVVEGSFVGADTSTDIAVFRVAQDSAAAARLGDPGTVRAGHLAIAVGRAMSGELLASHGVVNKVAGSWETWLGGQVDRLIRLDGGIHAGMSGGPVADAHGAVVGIATAALSRNYGVAVPATTVSRVVAGILRHGHAVRAFVGIGALPVLIGDAEAEGHGASSGLLVTHLVPRGPAQRAGILVGDILVGVDGRPATSLQDLRQGLTDAVGRAVKVELVRGGAPAELSVTAVQWPTESRCC